MSNNTFPPFIQYAAQQALLRERLFLILATLHPLLRTDVETALKDKGKLLHQQDANTPSALPDGSWGLLPLLIAHAINPLIEDTIVSSVSIAIECFVCALDLLDDIEDEDQTPTVQALGTARTLNVSTTLLMIAQKSLLSLTQHNVSSERVFRLLNALQSCALDATVGQHRDLLAERRLAQDMSDEECLEIAAGKAGAIMHLACLAGAMLADADETLCAWFGEMGKLLGIAHQLDNDSHDLYYLLQRQNSTGDTHNLEAMTQSIKSDLIRGKKTLPVVLAASKEHMLQENGDTINEGSEEHEAALQEGIITTWGLCLLYRDRARDYFQKIEAQQSMPPLLCSLLGFE